MKRKLSKDTDWGWVFQEETVYYKLEEKKCVALNGSEFFISKLSYGSNPFGDTRFFVLPKEFVTNDST